MQVVGHSIPEQVIEAMVASSDAFFALPLDRKLAARPPDLEVNRGYAASGTEALSYSIGDAAPPDLFEAFNMWVRFSYPRFREDQLQRFAWKVLIPLALLNIIVTAVIKVAV